MTRLPDDAWRDTRLLRAWRAHDFRVVLHLAGRLGLTPQIIAGNTGLPLDLVVNVMKGNTTLNFSSGVIESIARGFGMPDEVRGVLGLAPRAGSPACIPAQQPREHIRRRDSGSSGQSLVRASARDRQPQQDDFGAELMRLMAACHVGVRELARRAHYTAGYISNLCNGQKWPSLEAAEIFDRTLEAAGRLIDLAKAHSEMQPASRTPTVADTLRLRIWAERKARGWPARKMAEVLRSLADDPDSLPPIYALIRMIRGWEAGKHTPSEMYRLLYCKAFGMTEDELFGEPTPLPVKEDTSESERERELRLGRLPELPNPPQSVFDIVDAMKRREFLMVAATSAGSGAIGAIAARETIRHEIVLSLAEHHGTTDIEEWREIAAEYGQTYTTTGPSELLRSLMVDLHGLQAAIQRHHNDSGQRELRQVGAMLAAFTAQTIANLGDLREARRWWRTARRAADESDDRYAMLWIRGREIVRAGYEHRPLTAILQLIEEAEALIDETSPIEAMPEFLSGKAQTLGLIGRPAAAEAENALIRLRESFDALPTAMKAASDSVFTWGEERLRFTESMTYTYLGDYRKADNAQTAALALYPGDDLRSPAQIELQRALCLVGAGDVLVGIRHAQEVIIGLPAMHRVRPVADLGHKVLRAVPLSARHKADVEEYGICLNSSFTFPAPELMARREEAIL